MNMSADMKAKFLKGLSEIMTPQKESTDQTDTKIDSPFVINETNLVEWLRGQKPSGHKDGKPYFRGRIMVKNQKKIRAFVNQNSLEIHFRDGSEEIFTNWRDAVKKARGSSAGQDVHILLLQLVHPNGSKHDHSLFEIQSIIRTNVFETIDSMAKKLEFNEEDNEKLNKQIDDLVGQTNNLTLQNEIKDKEIEHLKEKLRIISAVANLA